MARGVGVELLIKHEAKPSALSCNETVPCACMCVVYVRHCVRAAPYGHNLADNSPSKSDFTGITACSRHFLNVRHVQKCRVLSKCAESSSAWVVAF